MTSRLVSSITCWRSFRSACSRHMNWFHRKKRRLSRKPLRHSPRWSSVRWHLLPQEIPSRGNGHFAASWDNGNPGRLNKAFEASLVAFFSKAEGKDTTRDEITVRQEDIVMATHDLHVNGINISYHTWGEFTRPERAVLLVHGLSASSQEWTQLGPTLAEHG